MTLLDLLLNPFLQLFNNLLSAGYNAFVTVFLNPLLQTLPQRLGL